MKKRAQNLILVLRDGREITGTFQEFVDWGEEVHIVSARASRPYLLPEGYEWADIPDIPKKTVDKSRRKK